MQELLVVQIQGVLEPIRIQELRNLVQGLQNQIQGVIKQEKQKRQDLDQIHVALQHEVQEAILLEQAQQVVLLLEVQVEVEEVLEGNKSQHILT